MDILMLRQGICHRLQLFYELVPGFMALLVTLVIRETRGDGFTPISEYSDYAGLATRSGAPEFSGNALKWRAISPIL